MAGQGWDIETDVLVVGSGAGALTTAVTAAGHGSQVIVVEKDDLFGGTSATSGGVLWWPATDSAIEHGSDDTPEDGFNYIRQLSDPHVPDAKIRAYAQGSNEMVRWLTENSEFRCHAMQYSDYHPELAGGKTGWRSHDVEPLDARLLGGEFKYMRAPHPSVCLSGRVCWTASECGMLLLRYPGWFKLLTKLIITYALDLPYRFTSKRDRRLTLGNAVIGRLKYSLDKKGVPLWRRTPLVELVREEGRVTGAVVERDGKPYRVRARRGVVLATGGFERNQAMRDQYIPGSRAEWTGAQKNNTGDGINAGVKIGAATAAMDSAWWAASLVLPGEDRARILAYERALPGCFVINQAGDRYQNEAQSYHISGIEMMKKNQPGARTVPSYIIFDGRYRRHYPMGPLLPNVPDIFFPSLINKVIMKAPTLEKLAEKIGVPPARLKATTERHNQFARTGKDEDFGRGDSAYDRYFGDPKVTPNPNLFPVEEAPFYAIPFYPGDLGTNGGLVTNENAQVVDSQGNPIPGLYATGNTTASIMGHSYPGAGATLGPAMYFGFAAGKHVAGANS